MAYSLITNVAAGGTANSVTSAGINTTGADFLVAAVGFYQPGTGGTFSDSKSNTWTALTARTNASDSSVRLYYAINPSVGSGHTFTYSGTGVYPSIAVQAWSGSDTTSPFDVENGAASSSAGSRTTGSVTPSQDNSLVVAAISFQPSTTISIDLSFTISDQVDFLGGNREGVGIAYLVQTSATANNPTWSRSSGSGALAAAIAAFKPAAAATGQPTMRRFGGVDNANFRCGSEGVKMWRAELRRGGLLLPDRSLVIPQPEMRIAN